MKHYRVDELRPEDFEKLKNHMDSLKTLEKEPDNIEQQIGEMAQIQDRFMVERRSICQKIEELKTAGNKVPMTDAETKLEELDLKIKREEETLEELFNKQDQVVEEISVIQKTIENLNAQVKASIDRIEEVSQWSVTEKRVPEVRVYSNIFTDTKIEGIHSSRTLKQNYKNVLIKEQKIGGPDEPSVRKIKVLQRK